MAEAVSNKPWGSFSESDYTVQQLARACLIDLNPPGQPKVKANLKLRVREPNGTLNRNGVFAAAVRISATDAPAAAKRTAARALIRLYGVINSTPPDSLRQMAGA